MPNLIMASAFGFLFLTLLSPSGPVINMLLDAGILSEAFNITADVNGTRIVIAFMNFLMWFGNTTLLLMSGVMGIDEDIFEAATVDGAGAFRTFFDITMPLLKPIFVYVFITSLIGGMQLFDVADIFTKGSGGSNMTSYTLIMYLNKVVNGSGKNFGLGGAISVILFIITAALSIAVFFVSYKDSLPKKHKKVVKTQ
jgi:multiple sugar transport system permease protein